MTWSRVSAEGPLSERSSVNSFGLPRNDCSVLRHAKFGLRQSRWDDLRRRCRPAFSVHNWFQAIASSTPARRGAACSRRVAPPPAASRTSSSVDSGYRTVRSCAVASRLRAGPGRAGATAAAHHVLQPLGGAARSARSLAHRPTGPRSGLCGVDAHVAAGSGGRPARRVEGLRRASRTTMIARAATRRKPLSKRGTSHDTGSKALLRLEIYPGLL